MKFNLIRLKPQAAFHFGMQGIDMEVVSETCPSDTLYAALFWQALQQGQRWANEPSNPPFTISSCFPYVDGIQLLPVPMLPPLPSDQQNPGERKQFKKVRFVSSEIFINLLAGTYSLSHYFQPTNGVALQNGSVLVSQAEFSANKWAVEDPLWKIESIPHVAVDRWSNASAYYETGQVRFAEGCGLAILALGDIKQLMSLLHQVGIDGLGGRRSKGVGMFEPELQTTSLNLPAATSDSVIVLSRYLPSAAELAAGVLDLPAAYSLEDVTGWMYSPAAKAQRRKAIWMIGVGSRLNRAGLAHSIVGSSVDVAPTYDTPNAGVNHPVWRHGLALTVGCSVGDSQ